MIGQRGSIIKEIRALTTPDIKIHEQEEGVSYRKLHIAGKLNERIETNRFTFEDLTSPIL